MTSRTTPSSRLFQAIALGVGLTLSAAPGYAAGTTYSFGTANGTSTTWENAAWTLSGGDSTSLFPNGAGDTVSNGTKSSFNLTLDITGGGTVTIGKFKPSNGSSSMTINPGSGGTAATLILDNTGGSGDAEISTNSGSSVVTVNVDVEVANTELLIGNTGAVAVNVGGNVTAANGQTRTITLRNTNIGAINVSGDVGGSGGNFNIVHNSGTSNTGDATLSGAIGANVLSITQNATSSGSELIISGDTSAFVGDVTVTAGNLNVTGANGGAGFTAAGGTFSGAGTVSGAVMVTGGDLAAGTDGTVGTLTFNSGLNLAGLTGSGQLKFDLDAVGTSDKVLLGGGALNIGSGALNFDDFSFTALAGFENGVYTLFDSSTSISGILGSSFSGTIAGHDAVLSTDGQDIFLTVSGGAIPEPSSSAAIFGLLALAGTAARRRRHS